MKKLFLFLLLLNILGCTVLNEQIGEYKIGKAQKIFLQNGTTTESLREIGEGLKLYPLNSVGIENFKQQYTFAQENYSYVKNKNILNLSEIKKYETLIVADEIYQSLPLETKKILNLAINTNNLYNDKNIFLSKVAKSFRNEPINSYTRATLKEWYRIFQRNSSTVEIQNLRNYVRDNLMINIGIIDDSYYFFGGTDYIVDRLVRRKEGVSSEFYDFHGYVRRNSNMDVVIKLNIGNIDDYSYSKIKEELDGKTILTEKRRVRISGFYDILDGKTQKVLRKQYFNDSDDYTIRFEIYDNGWSYDRDWGKRDDSIERMIDKVLNDALWKIKTLY